MEEVKKIKLSEILTVLLEFKENPTENNQAKIDDLFHSLQIRSYIPIYEKKVIVSIIVSAVANMPSTVSGVDISFDIAIKKIMYGLLSYISNLDNDIRQLDSTLDICCDTLYQFGVIDYILKYTSNDFHCLEKIIDDAINAVDIIKLASLQEGLKSENLRSFTETIKEMKKELTPEKLKDIKEIINAEDPSWKAFKETVGDKVMDDVINHSQEKIINSAIDDSKKNNSR